MSLLNEVLKTVPSYADLFGEISLCDCNHCESILSPAAYLVDTLQFLSRSDKNALGRTPRDVLLERRPDLELILLTCENSNTPLPAIDLVNEVLEVIVAVGKVDGSAAHDTGSVTAEELAANPQHTVAKARDILRDAVYPIGLPFDFPLETARAYFKTLGTKRAEVMGTLRQDALLPVPLLTTEEAIAAEALGCSALDFELITGMQFGGASATVGSLEDLYGLDAASLAPLLQVGARGTAVRLLQQKLNSSGTSPVLLAVNGEFDVATEAALKTYQAGVVLPVTGTTTPATWVFLNGDKPQTAPGLLCWVTEFLRRTERQYTDLVAICDTRTFNPLGPAIAALTITKTKITWQDVADLHATGYTVANAKINAAAGELGFPAWTGFADWLKVRFEGLAGTIVIEAIGDGCDLADARLRRVDGDVVPSVTLVAINRFLRLCERAGLSIGELDCALSAFRGLGISGTTDANLPLSLAALLRLRDRLKLSLPELAVLLGHLETGPRGLYTQLFLNRAALALDASFGLGLDGTDLAAAAEPISAHVPALIAAFRVTAEELEMMLAHAGLDAAGATMSLRRLAQLYRYPLLARALEISIADLLTMLALSPEAWRALPDQPIQLERLVADFDALMRAELAVPVIDQLLRHVSRDGSGEADSNRLGDLAASLHDDQIDLAAEVGSESGMSIERFQTLLARLVGPGAVDQLLGIVTGSSTFTAPYSKTPFAAAAVAYAPNITFEPSQKIIRFARRAMPAGSVVTLGALTDGELTALQLAAGGDADLADAVGILYAQPRRVLADTLAGLSAGPAVTAEILKHAAGARDVEGKLRFLAESLLPYIHGALARALIKQQVLPFTGLDAPILASLVDDATVITAPGSASPLSMPLRALERKGWFGEFFTSTTLTGPLSTGEAEMLSYDGVGGNFGQVSPVGSARWSAILLSRIEGAIVFEVTTTNGTPVLLWNGVAVPATVTGQHWRFDTRTVVARERIELVLEWRRTAAGPATLDFTWINGTDARSALPARRVVPAPVFRDAVAALGRLDKAARLLRTVEIEPGVLRHVAANPASFFGFSLDAFPLARNGSAAAIDAAAPGLFRGLLRVVELATIAAPLSGEQPLAMILSSASVPDAVTAMAAALSWKEADIVLFAGAGGFNIGLADVTDGRALLLIRRAITLTRRVGLGAPELLAWATKPVDDAVAEDIKRTVRAKFNEPDWLALAGGLNDPLRERWRDALVSYLLVTLGLDNSDQLFELLCLDIKVASCVKTSRIRHACFAVQTFVQRVHLNLENFGPASPRTVVPAAIDAEIWKGKQYYRVQEAARKVFCYPESYMHERLRDNMTPLFKRFVGHLGQAEMTRPGVESACLNYLKGLDEIARMDICGAYAQGYDAHSRELLDVVHMVGRTTLSAPYSYYYRRLEADRHWTPWERLPIDIDSVHNGKVEGVHVLPVIWNRRLYVFWPIIEEKPDEKKPAGNAMNESKAHREWRKRYATWQAERDQWVAEEATWKAANDAYLADKEYWELRWAEIPGDDVPYPFPPPVNKNTATNTAEPPAEGPEEPDSHDAIEPDHTHIEIRLAWSEFFDGHWSTKELSSLMIRGTELNPARYVFRAVPRIDGTLTVEFVCRHLEWQWVNNPGAAGGLMHVGISSNARSADRGKWTLSGAGGKLKVESVTFGVPTGESGPLWIVQPDHTDPMFNAFEQKSGVAGLTFNVGDYLPLGTRLLSDSVIQGGHEPLKTLLASPSTYRVTVPHHYIQYVLQGPCFYQDFARTYIVTREWGTLKTPLLEDPSAKRTFELKASVLVPPPKFGQQSEVPVTPLFPEVLWTQEASRQERIYGRAAAVKMTSSYTEANTMMVPASQVMSAPMPADFSLLEPWKVEEPAGPSHVGHLSAEFVRFRNLFHPHVSEFIKRLNRGGVDELLSIDTQQLDNDDPANQFESAYLPTSRVLKPYPREAIDFGEGAYAHYNRDLFFHAPMMMADVSEGLGLLDDAEHCLRFLLDPTAGTAGTVPGSTPEIFWQYLPFRRPKPDRIQDMLKALSSNDPALLALKADTTTQIDAWERDPFNPFLIGRLRIGAMQKYVVIRWLQHLILRADILLRSDRAEPINEAVQLLVLASNFAGRRAEHVPQRGRRTPHSYSTLKGSLDRFSNALVQLENEFPFSAAMPTPSAPPAAGVGLLGLSEALYFCIPSNEVLETLRDTIADRLFKIRHCMNIEGVVRDLALQDPPINPALLVAARAQGLDIGSVLTDLNAPRPHDHFEVCMEHASQAVEDVRRLGQDLKGILEAVDAEVFNVRRARQDLLMLREHMRQVKQRQVDESKARIAVLKESEKLLSSVRIPFYMRQLGLSERPAASTGVDPSVVLNSSEQARVSALGRARSDLADASQYEMSAKMMSAIPTITTGTSGSMASPVLTAYLGGHMLSLGLGAFAQMKSQSAADASHQATLAQIRAEVERRAEQWALELSAVVQEREQVDRQLLEARIALEIAEFQLTAHDRETDFAQDRLEFIENKPTRLDHQEWLQREVSLLLGQYYQVAFDECKRLQQVYRFDTGDLQTTFVEFGYFDKARHGLLAGERLGLSLRKMSRAYRDQDRYDHELSKPVSLALLDPMALVSLKATGACEFTLPESLFDADFPGHFMRRLHHVTVTIPCVTGPYTTVNATLTLLNSRIRTTSVASGDYAERPGDPRFAYHQGIMRSIATSSANEDSGMFGRNDKRSGPFAGYGAISRWRLAVPQYTNAFDLPTMMTDVILRVDYRSRPGGDLHAAAARKASITPPIKNAARLWSVRHEFSDAWHRCLQPADPSALEQVFEIDLDAEHFPYGVRGRGPKAVDVSLMLQVDDIAAYQSGVPLQAQVVLTPLSNDMPSGPPQTQSVTLQSISTRLDGLPIARLSITGKIPLRLQVKLKSTDIGLMAPRFFRDVGTGLTLRHRLDGRTARDMDILIAYDTVM